MRPVWLVSLTTLLTGPVLAQVPPTAPPLAEIVVTGERIQRTLMDTASSVVVTTADELDAQAAPDRVEQVLALTPNVQIGAGDQGPSIRGQDATGVLQGADAFLGGTRPRTTLQVDGRALGYNEFIYGLGSVWDVNRIEVFRTPQTTTQGRNSIGGAIFVRTNDPTDAFEARVRGVLASDDTRQGSALLSGPLLDGALAGRLAVDVRNHDSWVRYTGDDALVGADRTEDDYALVRGKLKLAPASRPGLGVLLTYAHLQSRAPQGEAILAPFRERSYPDPDGGYWETRVDSLVAELGYEFSPGLALDVTTAFGDSTIDRLSSPGGGIARVDARDVSVEALLRLDPPGSTLSGVLGLYGLHTDQDEAIDLSAFLGFGDFTDRQYSLGLFGEGTWRWTDRWSLTLGGRFQRDGQDRTGGLGLCDPDVLCFRVDYDRSFDAFLPKAALAFDVTPTWTVGALALRGFNPGGTTISFETGAQDVFDEETLWTYELYTRSQHADRRLLLTANAFYSSFDDAQRPQTVVIVRPDGSRGFQTEIANAPAARSYGLEAQSTWQADERLQLNLGLGLLRTELLRTLDSEDPSRGNAFQRAPRFSASAGVSWSVLPALTLDVTARHNSSYYSDDANTPELRIGGTTVCDLQLSWQRDSVRVSAFARNVADRFYLTQLYAPDFGTAGDPREYGVVVDVRFK